MRRKNLYALILILLTSCAPKLIITKNLENNTLQKINNCNCIFGKNMVLLKSSIVVANFETKGNFFTSGKFRVNESMNIVKKGITDLNYNALKIEDIEFPGPFKSKSYDIKGQILMLDNCPTAKGQLAKQAEDPNKKYIKLYRLNKIFGSGISFPIYLNEHLLCGLDNNNKITIEIFDSETNTNLQIESYGERFAIPVDFKTKNIIYIKCDVNETGRPKTNIESKEIGEQNFDKIKK
jgi:hypothetical protein